MVKRVHFLLAALLLVVTAYLFWPVQKSARFEPVDDLVLIAHAGGGLEAGAYSNSREAFEAAAARGFTYFEADFSWTGDGQLVLLHDWDKEYLHWFTLFERVPAFIDLQRWTRARSPAAFKALRMRNGLTPMGVEDLALWMDAYPEAVIITDIKSRTIDGLELLCAQLGERSARIIPQIYAPGEYDAARELGFESIILTTYRARLSDEDIIDFVSTHPLFALTVPASRLASLDAALLSRIRVPVFTHTINDVAEAARLREAGVAGIYTDYLYPGVAR